MQAIILAAGRGNRLAEFNPDGRPKCLLNFGGRSLLARQLASLYGCGVTHVTLVVGYEADMIIDHVATLSVRPEVAFVYNPAYLKGSVLSLLAAQDVMTGGDSVLVLDADVLFHPRIMQTLVESPIQNCFLIDRDFTAGDEPVKIAIQEGRMVEFRKTLPAGLEYDTIGESVGFFRFNAKIATEISRKCAAYNADGLQDAPHEEALRDVLLAMPSEFSCEDVTGLPWLEVDFPDDIERAIQVVLPAIREDFADF